MVLSVAFQIPLAQGFLAVHGFINLESSVLKRSKKSFANLRWQHMFRHSKYKNQPNLIGLNLKPNRSLDQKLLIFFYFCSLNCYLMFSSCVYMLPWILILLLLGSVFSGWIILFNWSFQDERKRRFGQFLVPLHDQLKEYHHQVSLLSCAQCYLPLWVLDVHTNEVAMKLCHLLFVVRSLVYSFSWDAFFQCTAFAVCIYCFSSAGWQNYQIGFETRRFWKGK